MKYFYMFSYLSSIMKVRSKTTIPDWVNSMSEAKYDEITRETWRPTQDVLYVPNKGTSFCVILTSVRRDDGRPI